MLRRVEEEMKRPRPVASGYIRRTKYAGGGILSRSMDVQVNAPGSQQSIGNGSGNTVRAATPVLISFTPTALRIGWKNPFSGSPPLKGTELQISTHPRDWSVKNGMRMLRLPAGDARLQTLVTGLVPNTQYFVRVRVMRRSDGMASSWSHPPLQACTEPIRAPDPSTLIRVTTPSAALKTRIEWGDAYAGGSKHGVIAYEVRTHVLDDDGKWVERIWDKSADTDPFAEQSSDRPVERGPKADALAQSAIVTGMKPATAFRVSVRAKNKEAGWGEWGPEFEFMAGPRVALPEPVDASRIRTLHATQDSVTVVWEPPESEGAWIEEYCLQVSENGVHWSAHHKAGGQQQSLLLPELQAGTRYFVRVKAKNALGWSKYSDPAPIRTLAPATPARPQPVHCAEAGATHLTMRGVFDIETATSSAPPIAFVMEITARNAPDWGGAHSMSARIPAASAGVLNPAGPLETLALDGKSDSARLHIATIWQPTYTFRGLTQDFEYLVRFRALNRVGWSSWSRPTVATTKRFSTGDLVEILWKGPFVNLLGWHLAQIVAVNFVGDDESQSFSAATSIVRVPKQDQRPSDQDVQLIARVMEFPDVDVPVRAGQLRELAAPLKHASISDLSVGCEVMVIADPDSMHDNGNAAEQRRRRLRGATEGILFGRRGTVLQVNLQAKMVDVSFVLPEQPGRAEQRFERSLPEACLQSPEQLKFWRNAMDDPGEYGNDANVVDFLDTPTPAENFRLHAVQRATTTPGNSASSPHARSRAPTVHKMDDLRRPPRRSPEEHPDEILDRQHKRAQRRLEEARDRELNQLHSNNDAVFLSLMGAIGPDDNC